MKMATLTTRASNMEGTVHRSIKIRKKLFFLILKADIAISGNVRDTIVNFFHIITHFSLNVKSSF